MTMTTTTKLTISQILNTAGVGVYPVITDDGVTWTTSAPLHVTAARRAVQALRDAGYVADEARDAEGAGYWVHVSPRPTTYSWRTDAASGEINATSVDAVVDALIAQGEWAALDSEREQRDIANGSFLVLHDADGCIVLQRGEV